MSRKLAILAAALAAAGTNFLSGPEVMVRRDPEPDISGTRNERRLIKKRIKQKRRNK
jgi:hypothetical protein